MMGMGFENALSEITLVLFTTLAPSGIVACIVTMALLLRPGLSDPLRVALNKYLSIPIAVALVGLVASATHLGNPANALYVLTGVGRSPLSNEVCAGVVFFGAAGSYWFYSFTQTRRVALERAWLALAEVAGVVFLAALALAYNVNTIPTWSHALVPVSVVLNALVGGPLLALVGLAAALRDAAGNPDELICERVPKLCAIVSAVALALNAVVYVALGFAVLPMENATLSGTALVPHYPALVAVFAIACAAGVAAQCVALRKTGHPTLLPSIAGAALALAGIFVMRFAFYMLHMTVGLF